MANVLLEHVSKQFPDGTVAVDGLSLEIVDREFLVLVGPSGCGKTTTLRLIAGLETSTDGDVSIGNRVVTNVAPKDRNIAMVFQSYALYPHLSVYKNMSFGLTLRSNGIFGDGVLSRGLRKILQPHRASEFALARDEIDNKVRQTALRLGIEHLLDRKPHQLSGGERQRVALGRAIVRNPAAFLLDEPLSNLDAKLRQRMRTELKRLHRELETTMIYVTHDQVEAMTLGDRVAVMNDGKILQVGRPLEIYQQPANLFVAGFIGSVPINLCPGTVKQVGERIRFEGEFQIDWNLDSPVYEQLSRLFAAEKTDSKDVGVSVVMGFRAEDVHLSDDQAAFEVEVTEIDQLGESTMGHTKVYEKSDGSKLSKDSAAMTILVRLAPDTELTSKDRVKLLIEPSRVLWFDSDSGENLLKEQK